MRSAHFKNRKLGATREGLTRIEGQIYRSCCWAISRIEAEALVGGWIYLHETKAEKAAFGGIVISVAEAERESTATPSGYAIVFEAKAEARGQAWRGADHGMAWWSGLVETSAPHELAGRE